MGKLILLFLLNLLILCSFVSGATVHGTIYDSDLETVNKVVVEVNSSPLQRHASKYGGYSFELEPGSYHIEAFTSYENDSTPISEIFVLVESDSGDYVVDLFLFPGVNLTGPVEPQGFEWNLDIILWLSLSIVVVILGFLMLLFVKFLNRPKRLEPVVEYNIQYSSEDDPTEGAETVEEEVPEQVINLSFSKEDDLLKKRIIKILDDSNGSIAQKEIRKKIKLSESKISEVISSLEKEKLVSKVKKGRSNLIVKN